MKSDAATVLETEGEINADPIVQSLNLDADSGVFQAREFRLRRRWLPRVGSGAVRRKHEAHRAGPVEISEPRHGLLVTQSSVDTLFRRDRLSRQSLKAGVLHEAREGLCDLTEAELMRFGLGPANAAKDQRQVSPFERIHSVADPTPIGDPDRRMRASHGRSPERPPGQGRFRCSGARALNAGGCEEGGLGGFRREQTGEECIL
jgi:hypothetical protein